MIAFGVANFIFSVIVGVLSRRVAAEALVGVATVLQLGLAVFLLVWVPDRNLTPVLFAVSALWGMCDAIWQIECNCEYLAGRVYGRLQIQIRIRIFIDSFAA